MPDWDLELRGRVAIVTGSSEGIGRATAGRLSAAGAAVVMCARRPDVLKAAAEQIRGETDTPVLAVPLDISRTEAAQQLVDAAIAEFGRLDVVVNNAGTSMGKPFDQLTDADWQSDFDLKLFGAIRTIRAALPHLRASGRGAIVNILNIGAKAPLPGSAPTSITRAAGLALTKVLSKELAADNITVNAVLIGRIKSMQWERRAAAQGKPLDVYYEEEAKNLRIPLGRIGETVEAADLITFLVSGRARYVSGVAVNMDGGSSPIV